MADRIRLVLGDITTKKVDVVVNPAKTNLLGGEGVDGAIHRAAGPGLLEECRAIGGCPTGEARITKGYELPARWVIHAVGPVWSGGHGGEHETLASCYEQSLRLAKQHGARRIAFPAISTGAYRFPLKEATRIAVAPVRDFLATHDVPELVVFVAFDEGTRTAYERALKEAA
jgi:O-acetyl-ADP-ribose deacetylase (regulator of RNase III)